MRRVVPSEVVRLIESLPATRQDYVRLNDIGAPTLSSILDLVDHIPSELLTMDIQAFASLLYAKALIKNTLATWRANQNAGHRLEEVTFHPTQSPLLHIRDALLRCPDESPAPATSELKFIADPDLRTNLRNDVGAINRALANGEWKAATVLAGSAIEALLLWSLQQRPPADITTAIAALRKSGELTRQPDPNLERWDLHEFTEVAANLAIIKVDTATETRLAREFRNLIHPGRAQRLRQKCDRGTALSSVAALDHVVRDLS
jgi:hypothetical protein